MPCSGTAAEPHPCHGQRFVPAFQEFLLLTQPPPQAPAVQPARPVRASGRTRSSRMRRPCVVAFTRARALLQASHRSHARRPCATSSSCSGAGVPSLHHCRTLVHRQTFARLWQPATEPCLCRCDSRLSCSGCGCGHGGAAVSVCVLSRSSILPRRNAELDQFAKRGLERARNSSGRRRTEIEKTSVDTIAIRP